MVLLQVYICLLRVGLRYQSSSEKVVLEEMLEATMMRTGANIVPTQVWVLVHLVFFVNIYTVHFMCRAMSYFVKC